MKVRLIPVDMDFADGTYCSAIKTDGTQYLIKWWGRFYAGTFSMQHYGLNFNGVYDAGLQFRKPGTKGSDWEAIWEIREGL